ncbi:hypothetical protein GA0070624_1017 [Micromonospora rhizosphaerae]|uniref:Uncharacterized protein n=1 Tax=Micromonospora rhizosphaerae TaxID=568872 RepID=A0A1C6RHH1_9ACTN|nr:hypothetical protein [Micromonospora rhizosphaerae]SCL16441.1 hypothetical protein GA0070624_1017 [Micromonospora rhizosphaerae]
MAEQPKKGRQQAEGQLEKVAENIRGKFEDLLKGRFADRIKDGLFADQVDRGIDRGRADVKRREQGGSV